MEDLYQVIGKLQHAAADTPTGVLRTEIQNELGVLDAAISRLQSIRPGAGNVDETIDMESDVWASALTVALYVCELITRPPERFARVRLSFN